MAGENKGVRGERVLREMTATPLFLRMYGNDWTYGRISRMYGNDWTYERSGPPSLKLRLASAWPSSAKAAAGKLVARGE